MKKICTAILFALFISCSNDKIEDKKILDPIAIKLDTLSIGNKIYKIQNLTDTNFAFKKYDPSDTIEALRIKQFSDVVWRNSDTLFIKCDNNKIVKLKDNKTEQDDYQVFSFIVLNKDINAYVILCNGYEAHNVWLINKTSADTLQVIGFPFASPDKKYFICANSDIEAGFTVNGLALYACKNGSYTFLGQHEINGNWGAEEVLWKNDTTVILNVVEKLSFDDYKYYCKALYIK